MSNQFKKDPAASLDYRIDWSLWLAGDTISESTWQADEGLVIESVPPPSHDNTTAIVWLSGGTVGMYYSVINHIITAGGREDERKMTIYVTER